MVNCTLATLNSAPTGAKARDVVFFLCAEICIQYNRSTAICCYFSTNLLITVVPKEMISSGVKLRYFNIPDSENHCVSDIKIIILGNGFKYNFYMILRPFRCFHLNKYNFVALWWWLIFVNLFAASVVRSS